MKGDAWNEGLSRVLDIGMEMYERWLTDSTLQLEDGGLSREEVRQGMAELAKFKSGAAGRRPMMDEWMFMTGAGLHEYAFCIHLRGK